MTDLIWVVTFTLENQTLLQGDEIFGNDIPREYDSLG